MGQESGGGDGQREPQWANATADLVRRAREDSLTELDNRATLLARLRAAETDPRDVSMAVLYLDVDHFKDVNDRLGHAGGDRVLRAVAERLRATMRPGDTVARIGGDEFVVLAATVTREEVAAEIAERVRTAMLAPIRIGGRQVTATISLGVTVGPGRRASTLLEHADAALFRAKARGRNRAELYRPEDGARRTEVPTPEHVLGEALDQDRLVVMYQPVVDLATGRVVTVDAMLRLHTGDGRIEAPEALLHLAEQSGLIVSLGAGMLDIACRDALAWPTSARPPPGVEPVPEVGAEVGARPGLSWPMSARQLDETHAAEQVLATLTAHHLQPTRLAMEVTERTLAHPGSHARRNLECLTERGVRLVVQDFGAGPASFALLREFAPDACKLDAAFMAGFGEVPRLTSLVEGIISLAQCLGITVIAQGVADASQAALLGQLGCHQGLGPYFGDPAAAAQPVGVGSPA
ncbi:MAG TPA: EAL domain-containing protein [Acidimicrobiales bacterium]